MGKKTGWMSNTLMGVFLSTTALATPNQPPDELAELNTGLSQAATTEQVFEKSPAIPLYTIQITPSIKLATDNQDLVNFLHEQLDNIDNEYAVINGIDVPDFIRRPVFFSEMVTGTPHSIQINIMSGESNFKETENAHGTAAGFGQFMRNTTLQNALTISQNRRNNPVISNIQGLFPQDIRIAYSKHHDKHLDRLTIIDPYKLQHLNKEQQRLILDQKEPILNWAKNLDDNDTLNEQTQKALKKIKIINPDLYAIIQQERSDLYADFKTKQEKYLEAMHPNSTVLLDEMNARRNETEIALTKIGDYDRDIIKTAMKQFSDMVEKIDDIPLTNALHHAINNNTTITITQLGLHSNRNIKTLKRNGIPVTEKSAYDAHFSGIGRAINTYQKLKSMPDAPVWKLFGDTKEDAEKHYGFVMLNPTNRNFYFHPKEEQDGEAEDKYKTIKEYHDYIKQKGFSERTVKLGQPNELITEALRKGDTKLILTDQDTIRVFSKIEDYALKVNTIEYALENPEISEQEILYIPKTEDNDFSIPTEDNEENHSLMPSPEITM